MELRKLSVRLRSKDGETLGESGSESAGDGGRLESNVSDSFLARHCGRLLPQLRSRSCSTACIISSRSSSTLNIEFDGDTDREDRSPKDELVESRWRERT